MDDWLDIVADPIDAAGVIASVSHPAAGGVAVFLGVTRAEDRADRVSLLALDYEAYRDMAVNQLRDLARRARERWPDLLRLAVVHRTGRVDIEQPSVVIAVSTPHRADAFDACRWLIDTLKAEVAVWKKEVWADGKGTWVAGN
ncbi:MAG TPA: molybdenum cofactor biosynthesis protein MoaE [Tepidisphaeraceae bacterium]|nr:molybdenum cofactor biosynthesis protein MoaE [Tepidisphaeraceae bacterium]